MCYVKRFEVSFRFIEISSPVVPIYIYRLVRNFINMITIDGTANSTAGKDTINQISYLLRGSSQSIGIIGISKLSFYFMLFKIFKLLLVIIITPLVSSKLISFVFNGLTF